MLVPSEDAVVAFQRVRSDDCIGHRYRHSLTIEVEEKVRRSFPGYRSTFDVLQKSHSPTQSFVFFLVPCPSQHFDVNHPDGSSLARSHESAHFQLGSNVVEPKNIHPHRSIHNDHLGAFLMTELVPIIQIQIPGAKGGNELLNLLLAFAFFLL